jgi:Fe2+ transport system protein FeoA
MGERPLSELGVGGKGRVVRIEGGGGALVRLQEMGLIRGAPVQFVRAAPLGDPIEVKVRGYNLSLRVAEATAVIVETDE